MFKEIKCWFSQHFTRSFYTGADPESAKKDWQLDCLFVLSGSAGIKAARRTLTKLTPNLKCHKRWQKQKYTLFFYLSLCWTFSFFCRIHVQSKSTKLIWNLIQSQKWFVQKSKAFLREKMKKDKETKKGREKSCLLEQEQR